MFKNRTLHVKMTKDNKPVLTNAPPDPSFEKKVAIISDRIEKIVTKAAVGAVVYVVADTARKVVINKTTT